MGKQYTRIFWFSLLLMSSNVMNYSAYFGNQQFTSSQLVFVQCNTALQVHWDWAWTMQDYVIESCTNGLTIVGGVCFGIPNIISWSNMKLT